MIEQFLEPDDGIEHCAVMVSEQVFRHIKVLLDKDVADPHFYRNAVVAIDTAAEGDIVELVINTNGGDLRTTAELLDALENTPATTIGNLVGVAHSAGGILFLACDRHIVGKYAMMMAHSVQGYNCGSVDNALKQAQISKKISDRIVEDTYKGFLTEDEIQAVKKSEEIWLIADEIVERLDRVYEIRNNVETEVLEDEIIGTKPSLKTKSKK